jgi:cytochrome c-type biogenesis protein CcmH/NrfF
MGMEFWLIPVLAMVVAGVVIFYMVIRREGGSGARSDGQTVVDKPANEPNQQAGWNYYK